MSLFTSKRFWVNVAAIGIYVGKQLGFDVGVDIDAEKLAIINILLAFLRARFGI